MSRSEAAFGLGLGIMAGAVLGLPSSRLRLAVAALRGQLSGGIRLTPRGAGKPRFMIEWAYVEGRVGKGVPLIELAPAWKDVGNGWINESVFDGGTV